MEELVSTESLPKTILAIAGVDVGDAMIGENLLNVVEKKDKERPNQILRRFPRAEWEDVSGRRDIRIPYMRRELMAARQHRQMFMQMISCMIWRKIRIS